MVRLLFRFYEPQTGEILVNGQNIKEVDIDSLRKAIAIVPQVDKLFTEASIHMYILYGNIMIYVHMYMYFLGFCTIP